MPTGRLWAAVFWFLVAVNFSLVLANVINDQYREAWRDFGDVAMAALVLGYIHELRRKEVTRQDQQNV